jgi:hypothetical protein
MVHFPLPPEPSDMAAKDVITLTRPKRDIRAFTDTSQDSLLTTIITAVGDAIARYC